MQKMCMLLNPLSNVQIEKSRFNHEDPEAHEDKNLLLHFFMVFMCFRVVHFGEAVSGILAKSNLCVSLEGVPE